ncbi:MAG: hypothetical protein RL091_3616 [Verrucomicrobiota bacterium]|jgi:hypothetical protein
MLIKNAIITALITWTVIFAIAVGIAIYRHDVSVKSLLEYVWGTSFVFALLGFLFRGGAATGDTVDRTEAVLASTSNPKKVLEADSTDAIRGFAFGTIVMLAASIVFGASLAILYYGYPA